MAKKIRGKKTGPKPRTGTDAPGAIVGVRCNKGLLARLDKHRRALEDKPPRSEAARRLIESGLAAADS